MKCRTRQRTADGRWSSRDGKRARPVVFLDLDGPLIPFGGVPELYPDGYPTYLGVRYLEDSFATWRGLITSVQEGRWLDPLGPGAGPFAESALLGIGLHAADEFIHHGAEIALLRDLYEARSASAAPPA